MVATAFDLAAQPHEWVACNLCGSDQQRVIAETDRYQLPARTVQCEGCGLQFLNPRMTAAAYAAFYQDTYRALLSGLHGMPYTQAMVRQNSQRYAAGLHRHVEMFVTPFPSSTLLDLGGGTGEVAKLWAERWGCRPTVVDPSEAELALATGCDTVCGTAESVDFPDGAFDVIALCRTIEHLRDPKGVLERARRWATARAFLVVDAMDVERWGRAFRYKVDHPYAFTARTLRQMVAAAGWRIRGSWTRRDGEYIGFVCSPDGL